MTKSLVSPIAFLLLSIGFVFAQTPPSPGGIADAATQIEVVKAPLRAAAADTEKNLAALQAWYVSGLDQLQSERTKAGDLESVIAIKAERDRTVAREQSTDAHIEAMPAPMRTLRRTYDASREKIMEDDARRKDLARRKTVADLETLQRQITTSGNIDQALVVKAEKDRLIAELEKAAPVAPLTTPRPSAATTPRLGAATGAKPTSALAERLIGTKWKWYDAQTMEFFAHGKAISKEPIRKDETYQWKVAADGRVVLEQRSEKKKWFVEFDGNQGKVDSQVSGKSWTIRLLSPSN